jgi:hypothetical protein
MFYITIIIEKTDLLAAWLGPRNLAIFFVDSCFGNMV